MMTQTKMSKSEQIVVVPERQAQLRYAYVDSPMISSYHCHRRLAGSDKVYNTGNTACEIANRCFHSFFLWCTCLHVIEKI